MVPRWRSDYLCHGVAAAGHNYALARLNGIQVCGEVVAQRTDAYGSHLCTRYLTRGTRTSLAKLGYDDDTLLLCGST